MAPTREMSLETKERIVKLLEEGNPSRMVAKDVGCSQSAVSKIWTKYKQHGMVVKAKRTGRPRKTSKRQDKQLKAICLENRKSTTKQMKHKWEEVGVNVCDRTVRNRLKEMGFQYRKAKRKPALTPKHKRTRLQWAKERQSWTVDDWMKVVFSDESRICIGQGDDSFVCHPGFRSAVLPVACTVCCTIKIMINLTWVYSVCLTTPQHTVS
uniref:Transposase Tc1-like domain-containing protein n=1 Tax=Xiphophorus maculatus TaxID=8083 RepID=A0A3B5QR73_XIPMA